ncbi:hypothetical protein, partial [Massilia sp. DWR3-1-1]|uniref:hypothetical protein n=1 Tax=Massilia sp. DWR3-1-1 TaxID=2804559 RepID=UPI003CEAC59F
SYFFAPAHESGGKRKMEVGAQDNKSRSPNGGPTPQLTRLDGTGAHPRLSHDVRRSTNGKEAQAELA